MSVDRRVILLTGLSGAGKTTATKSLEDIGFRTIDNLPHELLPALVEKIAADPQRCVDIVEGDALALIDQFTVQPFLTATDAQGDSGICRAVLDRVLQEILQS